MTLLHETEVDGVRCFWVESGRPTLAGSLLFRQGTADESYQDSGWLHMLEHLALHHRGGGALSVNGSVSPLVTSFDNHGPAPLVTDHLAAVCTWLSEPDFAELERERGVLRAESGLRENAVSRAMTWRYGAKGPGLTGLGEPGLGRATPESLRDRAAVFNRSNAILVLDGAPPASLRLPLREGSSLPPRDAVPCDDTLPAAYVDNAGLVSSGVVTRSVEATVLPALLQRALKETLRDDAGGAYAPWAHYEPVDLTHAVVFAGSDVNPDLMPTLVPTALDILERIGNDGPNPVHVSEYVEAMVQGLSDPYAVAAVAFRAAHAVFEGREPRSLETILDEARNISADSITGAVESFRTSLLLGVPGRAKWNDELPMLRQPTAPRAGGRRFRHQNWPASAATLTVGPEQVQLGEGELVPSITVSNVVGMHAFADGRRTVTCRDGWSISVDPGEWRKGLSAVSLLDDVIPADLHLPHPPLAGVETPPRLRWYRRWWLGLRRALRSQTAALVVMILLAGGFLLALVNGSYPGMFASGILFYRVTREWQQQRRRPER